MAHRPRPAPLAAPPRARLPLHAAPRPRRPPAARPLALAAAASLVALAAGACSDSNKGDPAPAATLSAAAAAAPAASSALAPPAPPPAAAAQPLGRRLACDRLLPEAARDRILPGYVLRQSAKCPECGPECTFTHPSRPYEGVQASLVCNEPFDAKQVKALGDPLRAQLRKGGVVKGFGRGGVHGEKDSGTFYTVLAFDDDSDCRVNVDWMRGERDKALELAKMALAGVKQADLR
jgi:hypothetical protein